VVELLDKRRNGKISAADFDSQVDAFRGRDLRRDLDRYAYRPSVATRYNINISGGNNLFNYSFAGGYIRSLNNVQNTKPDDQFTLRSTAGFRPVENLEINTSINYSRDTRRSVGFSLANPIQPYAQLADAEGHPLPIVNGKRLAYLDTAGGGQLLDGRFFPLNEPGLADRMDITRSLLLNISVSYKFTKWLSGAISYQYGNEVSTSNDYNSIQTYFTRSLINQYTNLSEADPALRNPIPLGGILDVSNNELNNQNARAQLNFNKNFGSNHQVSAMAASDISETWSGDGGTNRFYGYNKELGSYSRTIDYTTEFNIYGGTSGKQKIPNGSVQFPKGNRRFVSFLGNASYTYKGRYSLYASARKDGSNMFGVNTNRKWKPLWSTAASWDISKESFYRVGKWMPSLRLRVSFGYTGNPGNVTGLPTISYSSLPALYTNLVYAQINDAPNPDLRWEKVRTINAGLDFSFFKNKLSGNIDIWQKKSTDVIASVPVIPSTGIGLFVTNFANLQGKGFELRLNSRNIDGAFQWTSSFGLSYAKTIVTKLYDNHYGAADFLNYSLNASEGMMVNGIASFRWAGLDPLTGDPRGYYDKQVSTNYNAIRNDLLSNQVFHGSATPLYSGFLGNSFSWRGFSLSANITYRLNFYFRKPTINYNDMINSGQGSADYGLRWQKPGDEKFTNVPSFVYSNNSTSMAERDFFFQYAEINVLRGDNIRLQDIRLQYNWNNKSQGKRAVKGFSVFVYPNNLNIILWKKNKSGFDPDFTGGQYLLTPAPKGWTGGFNLSL
jgi:hypothetical protein